MMFAPGTRVRIKGSPESKGTVVDAPAKPGAEHLLAHNPWVVFLHPDGARQIIPFDGEKLIPIKNTLVIIGCTGNRTAYLNLSVEEATRRFLARENEHVYGDDVKKTELDSCDRVEIIEFADEFQTY